MEVKYPEIILALIAVLVGESIVIYKRKISDKISGKKQSYMLPAVLILMTIFAIGLFAGQFFGETTGFSTGYDTLWDNLSLKHEKEYVKKCKDGVLLPGKREKSEHPKVSILIPVYNREKRLPLALRSAQNQSLRDIEIVCLDDGSTDDSVDVIKNFQKNDPRIVLYQHEKNMGIPTTRKHIGQHATGKYVMSLDSDDAFCNPDIVAIAYNAAEQTKSDVVEFGFLKCQLDKFIPDNPTEIEKGRLHENELIKHRAVHNGTIDPGITYFMWTKLMPKSTYMEVFDFLGDDRLKNIRIISDTLFSVALIAMKDDRTATKIPIAGYLYNQNEDSVTLPCVKTEDGKFADPVKENKNILSIITVIDHIFGFTKNTPEGKKMAVHLFKAYFNCAQRYDQIAMSDHVEDFKKLAGKFLECEHIDEKAKQDIRAILEAVTAKVEKNNRKAAESTTDQEHPDNGCERKC